MVYVLGTDAVRANQLQQPVQRRLYRRTHRPALDVGAHDFIAAAKFFDEFLRLRRFADAPFFVVSVIEIALARQCVFNTGEAVRHHCGCGGAVARGHAAEVEGFFDVFLVAHPARHAGSLLHGVRQQVSALIVIQLGERARRCCRAEHRAEAVRGMAGFTKIMRVQRQRQAAAHIVAQRHGAQQLRAVAVLAFAHRQRGGHHATARMRERRRVRIVGLVGVSQHAVGQRRVFRRGHKLAADDHRLLGAAQRLDVRNRRAPRWQTRTGDHGRHGVEHMVLGALDHFFGHGLFGGLRDVSRKPQHYGRDFGFGFFCHGLLLKMFSSYFKSFPHPRPFSRREKGAKPLAPLERLG